MSVNLSLDEWIKQIRSPDAMTFENAYFGLRPSGSEGIPRLIAELRLSEDGYTRGKFCELLGEMGDLSVLPVLNEELKHPDQNVREWAASAIDELQSSDRHMANLQHLEQFKVRDMT